jgi:Ca2+/Na+ antiporter
MLYFPAIWLLSILFYVLFFIKLSKSEEKYNIAIERHPNNKFPRIKNIKLVIKNINDTNAKRDFKLVLLFLYLGYTLFFIPIIIYFILGIFIVR